MVEPATTTRCPWPWPSTKRGRFLLIASAVLAVIFWVVDQDWQLGGMAALSLWVVLGLMAQVRDLWISFKGRHDLTREEHWGWRFAVAWRVVVACLIVAYFLTRLLVTWNVLVLNDGAEPILLTWREMCDAVLLFSMIIAIASSPRLSPRNERRPWSWVVGLLGGVASAILCAIVLRDRVVIPFLVHVAIMGTEMVHPHWLATNFLATYGPARTLWFFEVTTAGVVSVLVSCGLLRLLTICWWKGWRQRTSLIVLLTAGLVITGLMAGRIALVEVPRITPILAANIFMPRLHMLVTGAVLAVMLASAAARRWSESPVMGSASAMCWRGGESRYYHERLVLVLLVAGVSLAPWVWYAIQYSIPWGRMSGPMLSGFFTSSWGCLSLAISILAVQSAFAARSDRSGSLVAEQPRLAPGLFLLVWAVLLLIIACGVPILGAWGFALSFRLA